jgi:hypothetical protein
MLLSKAAVACFMLFTGAEMALVLASLISSGADFWSISC